MKKKISVNKVIIRDTGFTHGFHCLFFVFNKRKKKTLINYSHEYKKVLLYTSFCQQIVFKRLNNII